MSKPARILPTPSRANTNHRPIRSTRRTTHTTGPVAHPGAPIGRYWEVEVHKLDLIVNGERRHIITIQDCVTRMVLKTRFVMKEPTAGDLAQMIDDLRDGSNHAMPVGSIKVHQGEVA
jgi:hypothetical protein